MSIAVVISTYGDQTWKMMALDSALPSVQEQGADEIIVHHEPDGTIASCRNNAAAEATADWLIFLEADDQLRRQYLFNMRRAASLAHGPMLYQPAVSYVRNGRAQPPRILPKRDLRHDNYLVIGTMISRPLFEHVGGFGDYPHGYEDWSLWAKAWRAGANVTPVARAVYVANVNPTSKHRLLWRNRQEQVRLHMQIQAELFPEMAGLPTPRPLRTVKPIRQARRRAR